MPTFNVLLKYMVKKTHTLYLKVQIFLFFSEAVYILYYIYYIYIIYVHVCIYII